MTIHDHVQKARVDLANSKSDYRELQVEAWGLCVNLCDALNPGREADSPISEDQVREVTIVLDRVRAAASKVEHNANWLRNCELIAAKAMDES